MWKHNCGMNVRIRSGHHLLDGASSIYFNLCSRHQKQWVVHLMSSPQSGPPTFLLSDKMDGPLPCCASGAQNGIVHFLSVWQWDKSGQSAFPCGLQSETMDRPLSVRPRKWIVHFFIVSVWKHARNVGLTVLLLESLSTLFSHFRTFGIDFRLIVAIAFKQGRVYLSVNDSFGLFLELFVYSRSCQQWAFKFR